MRFAKTLLFSFFIFVVDRLTFANLVPTRGNNLNEKNDEARRGEKPLVAVGEFVVRALTRFGSLQNKVEKGKGSLIADEIHSDSYSYQLIEQLHVFDRGADDSSTEVDKSMKGSWRDQDEDSFLAHPSLAIDMPKHRPILTSLYTGGPLTRHYAEDFESIWKRCALPGREQVGNNILLDNPVKYDDEILDDYILKQKFGAGGQGEVWRAIRFRRGMKRKKDDNHDENIDNESASFEEDDYSEGYEFVLKRIFVERGESMRLSGIREAVFGEKLRGHPEITRFVESFTRMGKNNSPEMWLVFHNEGNSLDSLIYTKVNSGVNVLLEPSSFWQNLRHDIEGALVRREIIRQIIQGLYIVHQNGVCHRDLKPSNLLVSKDSKLSAGFRVKISDFGSAVDAENALFNAQLYGIEGPTQREETRWYRPPEAFLSNGNKFPYLADDFSGLGDPSSKLPWHAFDIWSLGVIALEMLLGTPEVFALDARARAKIDHEIQRMAYLFPDENARKDAREMRYALKALEEFGIGPGGTRNKSQFNETIRLRDPYRRGFYFNYFPRNSRFRDESDMRHYGDEELDFVWSLFAWSPFERPTIEQTLEHPYFLV